MILLSIFFQDNLDYVGREHFMPILKSVENHQPLKILYKTFKGKEEEKSVYPYQLRQYNERWFLVASDKGYKTLSLYALDRIKSVEQLLESSLTKKARAELAEKTGISEAFILKWANHADLFRIKGVAGQYSELLEAAGVDTVVELASRKPENLTQKMEEINEEKKLVRAVPYLKMVTKWVNQAKELPRMLEY